MRPLVLCTFLVVFAAFASGKCGNLEALDKNVSLVVHQPGSSSTLARLFVEEWQSYIPPFGCNVTAAVEFAEPAPAAVVSLTPVPSPECPLLHCLEVYCPGQSANCFIAKGQGAVNITFLINVTADNASAGNYSAKIVFADSSIDSSNKSTETRVSLALVAPPLPATPTPTAPAPTTTATTTTATIAPAPSPAPTGFVFLPPPPSPPSVTVEEVLIALAAGAVFLLVMWWQYRKSAEE